MLNLRNDLKPKNIVITVFIGFPLFIFILKLKYKFQWSISIEYLLSMSLALSFATSKILDMKFIKQLQKRYKSIKKCKKLINTLKGNVSKKNLGKVEKKTCVSLIKDTESLLDNYKESLIELDDFEKKIQSLVTKYEELVYLVL